MTILRILASGAFAVVAPDGLVLDIVTDRDPYDEDIIPDYEGPTCSICDGLGHGYPGGGPCPLEDRGYDD